MKQDLYSHIIFFILISMFWACGDEVENLVEQKGETVFDTLSTRPSARILSYAVENAPTDIYSAINNDTRQITVYLPHYYALGFIDPLITIPKGASISPDADELVPVFSEEPFVYTVSAPGEDDVTYTTVPIVQQPELILNELSTEQDTTVIPTVSTIQVKGENFIPEVVEGYLIDQDGNEWQLGDFGSGNLSTFFRFRTLATTYDEDIVNNLLGRPFWIELRVYALKARMKYPIRFEIP